MAPNRKEAGRAIASDWLAHAPQTGGEYWVRINGGPELIRDLEALGPHLRSGVVLPKVASAADIERAVSGLTEVSAATSQLIALIETARGLTCIDSIASAPSVSRLMLGEIDLGAELNIPVDSPAWSPIRAGVVVASAAAGLQPPIAGVDRRFDDPDTLEMETRRMAELGFGGRAAIHPAQIDPINRAFTPSPDEVARALTVLRKHERRLDSGMGVYVDELGLMVDEAVVRSARRTIEAARRAGVSLPVTDSHPSDRDEH